MTFARQRQALRVYVYESRAQLPRSFIRVDARQVRARELDAGFTVFGCAKRAGLPFLEEMGVHAGPII